MKHPVLLFLLIAATAVGSAVSLMAAAITPDPAVLAEVRRAWDVADGQLQRTLAYLDSIEPADRRYPIQTENEALSDKPEYAHGEWRTTGAGKFNWSSGALPGMLFLMAGRETDPVKRQSLIHAGEFYATPLLGTGSGDMAMNSLFVLRPWYHLSVNPAERDALSEDLQRGAGLLAEPYDTATDTGRFHLDIGIMGYDKEAEFTDGQVYFHAFIDHTPNVEQLIYAARLTDDSDEATDWVSKAISHVRTIGATFGSNRNPGSSGTWQRSFWDWDETSPTYGQFLFNEAKQGHDHHTTWSRGQAWYIYGSSTAYAYTQDPSLLPFVKEQVDYYLANLPDRFPGDMRRPGKMVPPWDFDYALYGDTDPADPDYGIPQPDTEVDTSAAAMALAGLLQLVAALPEDDPDRARYLDDAEAILLELCSGTYLCDSDDPEMSILRHGCYHHSECMKWPGPNKDNGLIWGDFFFVWAMWCYLDLTEDKSEALETLEILPEADEGGRVIVRYSRPIGSLPFGFRFEVSDDLMDWTPVSPVSETVTPGLDGSETVELIIEPGSTEWSSRPMVRVAR